MSGVYLKYGLFYYIDPYNNCITEFNYVYKSSINRAASIGSIFVIFG